MTTEVKSRKQMKKSASRDLNVQASVSPQQAANSTQHQSKKTLKDSMDHKNSVEWKVKRAKSKEDKRKASVHNEAILSTFKRLSRLGQSYQSFHRVRDSLLSSSSGYTNYRGFLNLCVVLLVMSSGRLVLENILKYGFLVNFNIPVLFIQDPTAWPSLLVLVSLNLFILFAYWLEKRLEAEKLSNLTGNVLAYTNIFMALLLPAAYLWYREANPVSSFWALSTCCICAMKLVSYFQVNKFYRLKRLVIRIHPEAADLPEYQTYTNNLNSEIQSQLSSEAKLISKKSKSGNKTKGDNNNNYSSPDHNESMNNISDAMNTSSISTTTNSSSTTSDEEFLIESKEDPIDYPANLTVKNLYYFIAVPTLCYEINFPRSDRIRKRFLIRRCAEIMFLLGLEFILIQQWMVPILQNSQIPFRETNILKIIERLLKLAVPNHVLWLIGFYAFFHSYMNVLAEVLKFGDRQFYKDWWNAEDVAVFWQHWNIPVHNFCLRHIYKPLLAQGVSKLQAAVVVFFISAFFHEYLVSIPLRMFRLWSFFGMIIQIPFAAFVKRFLHGHYGNMAVWISLIIGQPIAIMMYIHDYYIDFFKGQL